MRSRVLLLLSVLAVLVVGAAACGGGDESAGPATTAQGEEKLSVFGAYATPIEEPWDGVIHSALERAEKDGKIDYKFVDDIGYSGDMERTLREAAQEDEPDVIFGDAFGNEEA